MVDRELKDYCLTWKGIQINWACDENMVDVKIDGMKFLIPRTEIWKMQEQANKREPVIEFKGVYIDG